MHHQFWITKKTVQRKLGSKEDACIILSDAELDSKIELFKSLSDSCGNLYRFIDQYQERLCILAQEENFLGKHLKETGKNSNTTGKIMINTGKSICYCGQQRMTMRPSLLRLLNELEVFRGRAIADTQVTINSMEKERTEYRAALSWMKNVSSQLDPDSDRALDKFRKAQNHVRLAKTKFDRLSLDCLQKIDLLAAARCNLFSHALATYMSALLQFIKKSSETFVVSSNSFSNCPQYNFNILKELSQIDEGNTIKDEENDIKRIDSDQILFFLDDYLDIDKTNTANQLKSDDSLLDISQTNFETVDSLTSLNKQNENICDNILINSFEQPLAQNLFENVNESVHNNMKCYSSALIDPIKVCQQSLNIKEHSKSENIGKIDKIDKSNWFQLFSELDILSNKDEITLDAHEGHTESA